MKRVCVLAAAAALFLVGCSTSTTTPAPTATAEAPASAEPVRQKDPNATYTKVSFEVPSMSCPHACWPKVKKTLESQPGVGDVTLAPQKEADLIDKAIAGTLEQGYRTGDIMQPNMRKVGTTEMGQAIVKEMERLVA